MKKKCQSPASKHTNAHSIVGSPLDSYLAMSFIMGKKRTDSYVQVSKKEKYSCST